MPKLVRLLAIALWIAIQGQTAHATTYTGLVAFGDSLTDTGTTLGAPYAPGRYSNGPIWIDYVAAGLGLSSTSSAFGGTNHAVGGAVTADMLGQVSDYLAGVGGLASPSALYVVWGGGNDGLGGGSPVTAAQNIGQMVQTLAAAGAQYFLVPNLPDLSLTPAALGYPPAAAFSSSFDATLAAQLAAISGVTIFAMDVYTQTNAIVANPGAYGFTNVDTPCYTGVVCANPDEYAWWDSVHPTTAAHAGLAGLALSLVAVPRAGHGPAAGARPRGPARQPFTGGPLAGGPRAGMTGR